jgi:hypothetical protein
VAEELHADSLGHHAGDPPLKETVGLFALTRPEGSGQPALDFIP